MLTAMFLAIEKNVGADSSCRAGMFGLYDAGNRTKNKNRMVEKD